MEKTIERAAGQVFEVISERVTEDVAFLVDVVTKRDKGEYVFNYDVRALLVKLSDRLHNMRTLGIMKPSKQMKIAGETGLVLDKSNCKNRYLQYIAQ